MAEGLKQKLGFVVAAMMMIAALGVLNIGGSADAQAKRCKTGGGNESPSPSPSETEDDGGLPIPIPPIPPGGEEEESASPSPSDSDGGPARRCPSEITLNYKGGNKANPGRKLFTGQVKSAEDACESGRSVILKKKKKGRDRTVDTTVTNNKGTYKIPAKKANGKYYSKTPKQNMAPGGDRVICLGDRSNTVRV